MDLNVAWLRFLQDVELPRHYPLAYSLQGGVAARNPVLDTLIPSFALLRLVSLLDESLEEHLARSGKPTRGTLHDHITALEAAGAITPGEAADLRRLKKMRNALAHEAEPSYPEWPHLDEAVTIVGGVLERLGLVGRRPTYQVVAEQGKAEDSTEPGILCVQPFSVRIEENGRPVRAFSWSMKMHRG
jgi:hypothetical protein